VWTFPNHKAYIAVTVHFENIGKAISMLLDLVEVAMLHAGLNLVAASQIYLRNLEYLTWYVS
jgi:hypothetical protein